MGSGSPFYFVVDALTGRMLFLLIGCQNKDIVVFVDALTTWFA